MNLIPFSTEPCKYEGWRMNVPRNLSIGTLSPAFYSFTHLLNGQESLEITDWHNDIGHSLSLSFSTVGACLGLRRDPSLSYIVIMMLPFFFFSKLTCNNEKLCIWINPTRRYKRLSLFWVRWEFVCMIVVKGRPGLDVRLCSLLVASQALATFGRLVRWGIYAPTL